MAYERNLLDPKKLNTQSSDEVLHLVLLDYDGCLASILEEEELALLGGDLDISGLLYVFQESEAKKQKGLKYYID